MRVTSLSWSYGMVEARIPILYNPLADPITSELNMSSLGSLSKKTPLIVLANDAFYVGDLSAFTNAFAQIRNKFKVSHKNGSPQVGELIKILKRWHRKRSSQFQIKKEKFAVLLPGEQWPVAVIVQIIHYLKAESLYESIILASEFGKK